MPARPAAPPASQDAEVFRLAAPVGLWWIWLAFVAANVADFAIQGLSSARFGAVVSAILLFVTGLVYALALRPRVIAGGAFLTVVNPLRTHRVPWRLIESVDTREWVRVRYGDKTLYCWALYVSARARRKIARGAPRPRRPIFASGFARASQAAGTMSDGGYAAPENSRMPDEARYLASLPVAKAMASRLDTRAARERARKAPAPGQVTDQVTVSWAWPALAAVVIPALILLVVALA